MSRVFPSRSLGRRRRLRKFPTSNRAESTRPKVYEDTLKEGMEAKETQE